jgi:Tfp pilus assembly protein PilO
VALSEAEINLAEIEEDLPFLELALPVGSDIDKYLQKPLESLTSKNNLAIKTVQFTDVPVSKPPTEDVRLQDMDFTLTVTGTFPNLLAFVKDLEDFVRITSIDGLDAKASGPELSVIIEGKTSFFGVALGVPNQTVGEGGGR